MSNDTCTPDECMNRGPRGGICKECDRRRALAYYYAHRDEMRAANKRYRDADPEGQRERVRKWFADNAERRALYVEEHRDDHNARSRAHRAANPGADTEYSRRWRREHPEEFALRNRENSRRRQTGTTHSRVTYADVLERDGMVCHICGGPIASLADLHFDHVIPLAKGGPHSADNIKPAHALCNLRKSDKLI